MSAPARRPLGALLLCPLLTLGLPSTAWAQPSEPVAEVEVELEAEVEAEVDAVSASAVLDDAREALKAGELDRAVAMLVELREGGGLSMAELEQAWLLEGMGHALLEDGDAERAFATALRLNRHIDPRVRQDSIRKPFEAAKASLPLSGDALWVRAVARRDRGGLAPGVRVDLLADDLGLVAACRLAEGDEPTPLTARRPVAFLATADPDVAVVEVLDRHGNQLSVTGPGGKPLLTEPHDDAHAAGNQAVSPTEDDDGIGAWFGLERFDGERWAFGNWPWVTLTGAGIGTVGLAVAVASGALVAVYDRGLELPAAVDPLFKPAMFVGLGVGVILIVAGGATIATDQVVRHELWRSPDERGAGQPGAAERKTDEGSDGERSDGEGGDGEAPTDSQALSWVLGGRAALE